MRNIALLTLILIIGACKPDIDDLKPINNGSTLAFEEPAPDDFSWTGSLDANYEFQFLPEQGSSEVKVLDENFNEIISFYKGSGMNNIDVDISISRQFDSLYVYAKDLRVLRFLPVTNLIINMDPALQLNQKQGKLNGSQAAFKSGNEDYEDSSIDCGAKCEETHSGNIEDLEVGEDEIHCLTGNLSGDLELKDGSTLIVCGNANLDKIELKKGATLVVSKSGNLSVAKLEVKDDATLYNHGLIQTTAEFKTEEVIYNTGRLVAVGKLEIKSETQMTNTGSVVVSGSFYVKDDAEVANTGSFVISGNGEVDCTEGFVNDCHFEISGDLKLKDGFTNNAYIKVGKKLTLESNGNLSFGDNSLVETTDFHQKATNVSCFGDVVISVEDDTDIDKGGRTVEGVMDVCDANGIEKNDTDYPNSFVFCETTIDAEGCIEEGFDPGTDPEEDHAIAWSYPSSGYAYLAFEDLWPSTGDYDFNDVVVKYKVDFEANKENKLTHLDIEYHVEALGGSLRNGLGFQLLSGSNKKVSGFEYSNLSGSEIVSVNKVDNTVLVLNDNLIDNLVVYYNNMGEGRDAEPETYTISVDISPAAGVSSLSLRPDLFLFDSEEPQREMHLPNHPPSAAADLEMLNTFEDKSSESGYYLTKDNYPWVIEITGSEVFQHPKSKINIKDAYPDFVTWVKSGGRAKTDWYLNPDNGKVL